MGWFRPSPKKREGVGGWFIPSPTQVQARDMDGLSSRTRVPPYRAALSP